MQALASGSPKPLNNCVTATVTAASLRAESDNNQASLSQRQMPVWKVTTE